MPNIGFWATAGGGGASAAYELIATTAGTGASSTVTFSSIPAGYKHLQLRMTVGVNLAYEQGGSFYLRFNGDAGANYADHALTGNGSTVGSGSNINSNQIGGAYLSVPNNPITVAVVDVLDAFSTTKNKTLRMLNGYAWTSNVIALRSGHWRNTAAVTSMSILELDGRNFSTRSRFSLYGIKG